jgi:predicted SnoaL-like aldol condensation-catalyzing enzyme
MMHCVAGMVPLIQEKEMKKYASAMLFAIALAAPSAQAADAKEEANKKRVVEFYEKALNQKNLDAVDKYLGPYRQHNPQAADGPEGLKGYIKYLKGSAPDFKFEIKRVLADGDFVILHVHGIPAPGARGLAIVDIFRVDGERIVEHWDVVQEIPEKAANGNSMF